jgi:hypothetical protein
MDGTLGITMATITTVTTGITTMDHRMKQDSIGGILVTNRQ